MSARTFPTVLAASLLIVGLASLDADAAQRGNAQGKTKNGSSFCRSGVGHPVYGRQWCLERGHGLGESTWHHARVGKVVFGRVPNGTIESLCLGAREIAEILTGVVLDEIFGKSHYDLDRAQLGGSWRGGSSEGILVLEVLIGGAPVAELTDTDLDGEVDVVLIAGQGAFLVAAPVFCLPTFGWAHAVDTDPTLTHPAAAVAVAGSGRGLELESPDQTSGGFLANLNELLAPKEILRDITRLGSDSFTQDAFVLGGGTVLTLLAVDDGDEIALSWRPERLGDVSAGMSFVGSRAFLYPALVSTFFIAKATERPGLSRTAAQMTQALLLTDVLVTPIKLISRRTRPDGSNDRSFPSGHTAGAFALATVLQHNHGLKVGLPAYAFASLMGAARVDERKHFVSDVIVGAAIGYFAASTVNKRFAGAEVQVHMVRDPSGGKGVGFTLQF